MPTTLWRRPLHAMTGAFTGAGFRLRAIGAPGPERAARELFPDGFQDLSANPDSLFLVVEPPLSVVGSGGRPVADHP
ncbi:hypothetical protein ACIBCM_04675 [Streptomyces sp. NPDC051018]|uniref:hypothetical protein n=1 Tax=Streptomyces sp. NPDC051018 TaxID=3365639 RepID=UPI00378EBD57